MAFHLPVNIPGHPKVTNLGYSSCSSAGQKAIPCSYISLKYKQIISSNAKGIKRILDPVLQVLVESSSHK